MSCVLPPLTIAHFTVSLPEQSDWQSSRLYALCLALRRAFGARRVKQRVLSIGESDEVFSAGGGLEEISLAIVPAVKNDGQFRHAYSYALAKHLRGHDILHIHEPFTPAGESVFCLAKNIGVACLIDGTLSQTQSVGWRWGAAPLADAIYCCSEARASELRRASPRQLFVLEQSATAEPDSTVGLDCIASQLVKIYETLAASSR